MDYDAARLVTDIAGLDRLRTQAREDPNAALGEVARQFESLLVNMMVKSMRQAGLGEGALDNRDSLLYRDLYDQQLAMHLAERGMGLADVIQRQLGGGQAAPADGKSLPDYLAKPLQSPPRTEAEAREPQPALDNPQRFVVGLMPWAREAAARLGIAPEALLAQAALETGWGRSVIHGSGGNNSHNLFGIKADGRWGGGRVAVSTLEYVDGVAVRRKEPFRAYASYRESFDDYVGFVRDNPRYREALTHTDDPAAYFDALQKAGYATDPAYADKVMRVLNGREMRGALERLELQVGSVQDAPGPVSG
jgi:flagellar protein FlgJ